MPAVEANLHRFKASNTQVLGVSVDSVYSHANWASDLGGISFPLLADFNPKGAVASAYGVYLSDHGITDRATVIVDSSGTVRHVASATPGGERDISELLALCEQVDRQHPPPDPKPSNPPDLPGDCVLYVKSRCGFSRAVLLARTNLHLEAGLPERNITDDHDAERELVSLTGKSQAPCLVVDGKPLHESNEIIRYLAGFSPWAGVRE